MIEKERKEGFFYTASISGGKDSICMGLLLIERGYPVDDFIFFDMGVEYPETYDAIAKFERDIGRKVARVTPPLGDFWWYYNEKKYIAKKKMDGVEMNGYGCPTFASRWCTALKREAIKKYERQKNYSKSNTIQYIGIAADEPKRIRNFADKRYPLYEWGITEADALNYCRSRGYYPPRTRTTTSGAFLATVARFAGRNRSNISSNSDRNSGRLLKTTRSRRRFAEAAVFNGN